MKVIFGLLLSGIVTNAFAFDTKSISCSAPGLEFSVGMGDKLILHGRNAGMTKPYMTVKFSSKNGLLINNNPKFVAPKVIAFKFTGLEGYLDNSTEECNSGWHYQAKLVLVQPGLQPQAYPVDCLCFELKK